MNSEEAVLSGKLDCVSKFTDYSYLFIYLFTTTATPKKEDYKSVWSNKKKKERNEKQTSKHKNK